MLGSGVNAKLICEELISDIESWVTRYPDNDIIIAGDFNTDLDNSDPVTSCINSFCQRYFIRRSQTQTFTSKLPTYINATLNHASTIDYILSSDPRVLIDFSVRDLHTNFSDHVPIMANLIVTLLNNDLSLNSPTRPAPVTKLRWDHADTASYYNHTRVLLEPLSCI